MPTYSRPIFGAWLLFLGMNAAVSRAAEPAVTGIAAIHHDGQTFVTWKDAAEGETGTKFRYDVYRSDRPITEDNLAQAECCARGVLNNSAKLFGSAFFMEDRLNPDLPYSVIQTGGEPLPPWSGLAVHTARAAAGAYYAVVATDEQGAPQSKIVPGESSTLKAIEERPGPTQPIKLYDSAERTGQYVRLTKISGTKGLPLHVTLHGSSSRGGGAGEYGDYFLYFGTPQMGYRDGLPGVFSVSEARTEQGGRLLMRPRDAVEHPTGARSMETYWFGYYCRPQWADHADSRVYSFTENQLLFAIDFAVKYYGVDPQRITMGGTSSGAVGSFNVGFRHPELFAAVFPTSGRVRNVPAVGLEERLPRGAPVVMADGKTNYYDYVNAPLFAAAHHEDLPFLGWACGRNDGYATWPEQIALVQALTEAHHGFAFSWNNGNHSSGGAAMRDIAKYYPGEKFALNLSYPALGNSSLDSEMGSGDVAEGDLEGGINLGFDWKDVVDETNRWSVALANELAQKEETVDVTPRRCQKFRLAPGTKVSWRTSRGGAGEAAADAWGLVTIPRVTIGPKEFTVLTLEASRAK